MSKCEVRGVLSDTAREREFYKSALFNTLTNVLSLLRYLPRFNASTRYFNPYCLNSDASSVAHSSYDTALTAFA